MSTFVQNDALWQKAKAATLKHHDADDAGFDAHVLATYRALGGGVQAHAADGLLELSDEVVRASGTSEGAKKGWGHRVHVHWTDRDYKPHTKTFNTDPQGSPTETERHAKNLKSRLEKEHADSKYGTLRNLKIVHEWNDDDSTRASDATPADLTDTLHCRDYAGTLISASTPWTPDAEAKFMHMPAGVHTITAGFRDRAIKLTVEVDPEVTAQTLQSSFERLQASAPKQRPFGCVEHDERDASFWPTHFEPGPDGVYLAGEPSALGAEHVNGRIHRSWSPSFTTDADYTRATCSECDKAGGRCKCSGSVLEFPDGVRGSVSNPARVTGTAFVVGTLTNKPAFHAIAPVKAREAGATVKASGTSEGSKEGWRKRKLFIEAYGVKGMKSVPWRKQFKSAHHFNKWADEQSAETHGSRVTDEHGNDVHDLQPHERHKLYGELDEENHASDATTPTPTTQSVLRAKPAPDRRSSSILARLSAGKAGRTAA